MFKYPYLCNSFFIIPTLRWKSILKDKSLFVDEFDEVPINKYREINNQGMLFIMESCGINVGYNTIDNYNQTKDLFYKKLVECWNKQ